MAIGPTINLVNGRESTFLDVVSDRLERTPRPRLKTLTFRGELAGRGPPPAHRQPLVAWRRDHPRSPLRPFSEKAAHRAALARSSAPGRRTARAQCIRGTTAVLRSDLPQASPFPYSVPALKCRITHEFPGRGLFVILVRNPVCRPHAPRNPHFVQHARPKRVSRARAPRAPIRKAFEFVFSPLADVEVCATPFDVRRHLRAVIHGTSKNFLYPSQSNISVDHDFLDTGN